MSTVSQVAPFDYVIFGASGDLTTRKLLPAFYYRLRSGEVPDDARIIGVSRSDFGNDGFRDRTRDGLKRFVEESDFDEAVVDRLLSMVYYVSLDGGNADADWSELKALLDERKEKCVRVFYFATAPGLYEKIAANLDAQSLITPDSRVVLEKPIGTDGETARAINDGVGKFFEEKDIFRIDHYLGKETVQDVIALRFANPMLEAVWSADYIESVQITAAESVGVEKRAEYYDTSGALRDMVQNHLLQVLCIVAMEQPKSLDADAVRDAKLAVLQSLKPLKGKGVKEDTVRAQYVKGTMKGAAVPGYLEELGHESNTETYVAIRAHVDTPRWKNVPFYVRTAKRVANKVSEIVVTFRQPVNSMFPATPGANVLVIHIQPDEGLTWHFNAKNPVDDSFDLRGAKMSVNFGRQFKLRYPDAYERLLLDAVRGNPVLFIRRDEVEAAWNWIEPILDAWAANEVPMSHYAAGSQGPEEAAALLAQNGDKWHQPESRQ